MTDFEPEGDRAKKSWGSLEGKEKQCVRGIVHRRMEKTSRVAKNLIFSPKTTNEKVEEKFFIQRSIYTLLYCKRDYTGQKFHGDLGSRPMAPHVSCRLDNSLWQDKKERKKFVATKVILLLRFVLFYKNVYFPTLDQVQAWPRNQKHVKTQCDW